MRPKTQKKVAMAFLILMIASTIIGIVGQYFG